MRGQVLAGGCLRAAFAGGPLRFLTSKRRWINEKVASARTIASQHPHLGLQLPSTAWIGGDPYPIVVAAQPLACDDVAWKAAPILSARVGERSRKRNGRLLDPASSGPERLRRVLRLSTGWGERSTF